MGQSDLWRKEEKIEKSIEEMKRENATFISNIDLWELKVSIYKFVTTTTTTVKRKEEKEALEL